MRTNHRETAGQRLVDFAILAMAIIFTVLCIAGAISSRSGFSRPYEPDANMELDYGLSNWESSAELGAFLERDNPDRRIVLRAGADGRMSLVNRCEVGVIQMIDRAGAEGRRLSFVPLHRMEYFKWYGRLMPVGTYHAVCGALVGDNEFWYVEPADNRCWLGVYLEKNR